MPTLTKGERRTISLLRAAQIRQMRAAGQTHREIADTLRIADSTVRQLATDPLGEKARALKETYRRPCPECGELMNGSDGPNHPPPRCDYCQRAARVYWTEERIVEAFRAFAAAVGRPPSTTDAHRLAPSTIQKMSPARRLELVETTRHRLPPPAIVNRKFGSWTAALAAAGFPPTPVGRPARR
jgi:hypothetical protein